MEMRVKTALYAYPQLDRIGREYEEHIKNRAILSYGSKMATEKLTEYIAEEIVRRRSVERLKEELSRIVDGLTEEEKWLLDARYFGKVDRLKRLFAAQKVGLCKVTIKPWCERTYYRKQARLLKKIVSLLKARGIDEALFDNEYLDIEYLALIYQYLMSGKEIGCSKKESAFLAFLSRVRED